MSAATEHTVAMSKLAHRCDLAEALAPSFRDKFDFSEPKHFDAWADMAVTAADAIIKKQEALLAEEKKRFEDAKLAEKKAEDLANFEKEKEAARG
jgi:hypothetical protein